MTKEEQEAYEITCLKLIAMEDYFMDVLNKSIAIGLFGLDIANTGIATYAKQIEVNTIGLLECMCVLQDEMRERTGCVKIPIEIDNGEQEICRESGLDPLPKELFGHLIKPEKEV